MNTDRTKPSPLPWLLEDDPENPGVRYFALRDLQGRSPHDPELQAARRSIMLTGPVPVILEAQNPDGSWPKAERGSPLKYRTTNNQVIYLAELGADESDERVRHACEYVLEHAIAANHAFSVYDPPVPSGVVHCLNGNLLRALIVLGCGADPRLQGAVDWQARAITGEAPQVNYYKSTTAGPYFACGVNLGQPCAWGATKAMRALAALPEALRTEVVTHALLLGTEFLFSHDPALADYPYTERVSSTWFKFGFPLSYWSDVLETVEALAGLGYAKDPRLDNAIQLILSKQDDQGRWLMENSLNGKMWVDIETKGKSSKWVTLRTLRVLKSWTD
jgi:hypothetical protein